MKQQIDQFDEFADEYTNDKNQNSQPELTPAMEDFINTVNTADNTPHPLPMGQDPDLLGILLSKDEMLSNPNVNKSVQSALGVFHKTLALSNIKREDIFWILEGYADIKVASMMAKPKSEFSWEEESDWTRGKAWLKVEATRGVDGFEREMQVTQISNNTSQLVQDSNSNKSGGFMNYIRGALGGGQQ